MNSLERFDFGVFDLVPEIVAGSVRRVVTFAALDHLFHFSFDVDVTDQFLVDIAPPIDLRSDVEVTLRTKGRNIDKNPQTKSRRAGVKETPHSANRSNIRLAHRAHLAPLIPSQIGRRSVQRIDETEWLDDSGCKFKNSMSSSRRSSHLPACC